MIRSDVDEQAHTKLGCEVGNGGSATTSPLIGDHVPDGSS